MTNLYIYNVLDEDFIHKLALAYTESGLYTNSLVEIKRNAIDFIRKENRLYHTAKEYVDDVVSFDNLGIGNFYGIFKIYFAFCLIVLIVFVVHSMVNFILSRGEQIELIIYRNFQRFVNMKNRTVSCFKSKWLRIKKLVYNVY